jgi:energy-coupling factor transporter ATP-binding protein EcfA2
MIHSTSITSGFAKKFPLAKQLAKTKLSPSLNILWGENGSGKTSILQIMAAYSFCHGGGWTRLLSPIELRGFGISGRTPNELPHALARNSPGESRCEMDWDRAPVFFDNGNDTPGSIIDGDPTNSPDGILSGVDGIVLRMKKPSSGQMRKFKLNTILNRLQDAPDFKSYKPRKDINDTWQKCLKEQADYLAQRPESTDTRVTILMDEPEKHLDLATANRFWNEVIPHLTKFAQVIIATHHPLALAATAEDTVWISPKKGEHLKAKEIYQNAFSK